MNTNSGELLQAIIKAMSSSVEPLSLIPPPILMVGAKTKKGLSARNITANTLERLSAEGIPVASVHGKDNLLSKMIEILSEEIISELITNGKIQISIDPGGVSVNTLGGNIGGPVSSQGMNTNIITGEGVIS